MKHVPKIGLRMRLNLLILLTFMPAGILLFFTAEHQRDIESKAFLREVLLLARGAAVDEAQQVSTARDLLLILSEVLRLKQTDPDQITAFLKTLTGRFSGYRDLGVLAPDGALEVNSRNDPQGVDYGGHAWFRRVVTEKQFAMSEYRIQQIGNEPVMYFGLPVMDDGDRI